MMKSIDNTGIADAKAVMSEADVAGFEQLPAAEQLSRLRAAIDHGFRSAVTEKGMNDVWAAALARNPDASL